MNYIYMHLGEEGQASNTFPLLVTCKIRGEGLQITCKNVYMYTING